MNTTTLNPNFQYILDSSYSEYIKNYMSENFPAQLLKFTFNNEIDQLIIEIGTQAIAEHDSHYHLMDNSTPDKANTNHLMAKEHANNLIVELLKQKFNN